MSFQGAKNKQNSPKHMKTSTKLNQIWEHPNRNRPKKTFQELKKKNTPPPRARRSPARAARPHRRWRRRERRRPRLWGARWRPRVDRREVEIWVAFLGNVFLLAGICLETFFGGEFVLVLCFALFFFKGRSVMWWFWWSTRWIQGVLDSQMFWSVANTIPKK